MLFGAAGSAVRAARAATKAAAAAVVRDADTDEDAEAAGEFDEPPRPPVHRERARDADAEPFGKDFEGVIPNLRRRYEAASWVEQEDLEPYRTLRGVHRATAGG